MSAVLFPPPALDPQAFRARGLTIMPVTGDGMSPTLRSDWDFVLVAPVKGFTYDSLYVVEQGDRPCIYRCQSHGPGEIGLLNDNPAYGATPADRLRPVPAAWLDEHVLGIVACDLKVRDANLIQQAWKATR